MRRLPYSVPLNGVYKEPYSTPPEAKVSTKHHHKTMKFKVPEAEILRTPTKIEKLRLWLMEQTWRSIYKDKMIIVRFTCDNLR